GDLLGPGIALQASRGLPAVHHRQRQVHHDDVREEGRRLRERLLPVLGLRGPKAGEPQEQDVDGPVVRHVVHDEHERPALGAAGRAGRSFRLARLLSHQRNAPTGMIRVNVEPSRTLLSTVIWPPSTDARRWQMARPRPVPPPSRADVESAWENASKMRPWSSGAMPMPVSATAMEIVRFAR